jgi:hypothetical protein
MRPLPVEAQERSASGHAFRNAVQNVFDQVGDCISSTAFVLAYCNGKARPFGHNRSTIEQHIPENFTKVGFR